MKGVILDAASLGDVDLSPITSTCCEWQVYPASKPDEVVNNIGDADVVLSNKIPIGAETLRICSNVKFISVLATGTNNVDLTAAAALNIPVSNAVAYGTASVVQHTISLILALSNSLKPYLDDVANDRWQQSDVFCLLNHPISELNNKTLGIVGLGELGSNVAKIAEAFGMQVIVAARDESDTRENRMPLEQLLAEADYVSLHCPLTSENQHLMDAEKIALMKPSAFLINTARGGLINAPDLVSALNQGVIAGAALDVLEIEPASNDNALIQAKHLSNLLITPHNAWAAIEARQRLVTQTVENIEAFSQGRPIRRVN